MVRRSTLARAVMWLAGGLVGLHCTALANPSTQLFTVTVPSVLTITPPVASVTINHDQTDNNQAFAAQQWVAASNGGNGATLTFKTLQAFEHTGNNTFKRNARLDLAVASSDSGSGWAVTIANDTTNYAASDGEALVRATSTAPGEGRLNLTVTFITTDFSTLLQGNYTTTVEATIAAN